MKIQMIFQTFLEHLFRIIYFLNFYEYKPIFLILFLTIISYSILFKIDKKLFGKDTELAKHNMYKTYKRKDIQKSKKVIENKVVKVVKVEKNHTTYHFFVKEEWPKLRQEFKNYHYKELLQYLSLRWYIVKNDPLKLQKYQKIAVDTVVDTEE